MATKVCQNFHPECEEALNDQIALEFDAVYMYTSLACYYGRAEVALPGFSQYFMKSSREEYGHVQLLCNYLNKRGGKVIFEEIKAPAKNEWESGLDALETALEMEKRGNELLLSLHKKADEHGDYDLANFLEENFLKEVVCTIKELGDHMTNLRRVGNEGHGLYHFDKKIH